MSFSENFAANIDYDIFGLLGDEITVINTGVSEVINAEFITVLDSDELIKRGDVIYPTLEIMNSDTGLFSKGTTINFNGKSYLFVRKQPKDSLTTECVFRNIKVV